MRQGVALALVSASVSLLGLSPGRGPEPLPARMADTGGGTQLITAAAPGTDSASGTVTWWDLRDGQWVEAGSAPARFGANGLVEGGAREQGTNTTPTGLYGIPFGFGIRAAPAGTRVEYRPVTAASCVVPGQRLHVVQPLDRAAARRLPGLAVGGTELLRPPVRVRARHRLQLRTAGARARRGIFLHVNGKAATAGCVLVPEDAMRKILSWADPAREPHIAIGTTDGATAVTRY